MVEKHLRNLTLAADDLGSVVALAESAIKRVHDEVADLQAREAGQRDLFDGAQVAPAAGTVDVAKALELLKHLQLAIPTGNQPPMLQLIAQLREVLTDEAGEPARAAAAPIAAAHKHTTPIVAMVTGQLTLNLDARAAG